MDELLTVAEAAKLLKVTRHTVYRWIAEGRLPAVRYSPRVLRVMRSDLERSREGHSAKAVRETGMAYEPTSGRDVAVDEEREEVRRLMEKYRKLSNRPRRRGEPPKGSAEAILRHSGVISMDEGEELRRIIGEDRQASINDPGFSFDEPA
jgi:excisionase family DNA binding protein